MFTLKICEGEDGTFKNVEDAIKYIYDNDFERDVTVYAIKSDDAIKKMSEIYEEIKNYNIGKPLNNQILPSNPTGFRGILGCTGVQCYTITLGRYGENYDKIAIMSGWNESVLDESLEKSRLQPSIKALSSLYLLMTHSKM